MHIATCQEDLSWLPACDLLEGLTIRVVHKCSAAHPGLKRGPDGLLGRREWNPPPLREDACISHVQSEHPEAGRESEVYLSELAKIASSSSRDDDLHVFMQGDGTCDVPEVADIRAPPSEQQRRQVTDALRKLAGMPVSAVLSRPRATALWQTSLTHPPRLPSTRPTRPRLCVALLEERHPQG